MSQPRAHVQDRSCSGASCAILHLPTSIGSRAYSVGVMWLQAATIAPRSFGRAQCAQGRLVHRPFRTSA
eukprot:15451749-Alexandrium_andersonii.AAC.1